MSIYGKDSYSQSKVVYLAGPIEYWWQGDRFHTFDARLYRYWRSIVSRTLVENDFLVFRPHESFKGPWNEKMQEVNTFVLSKCDFLVNLKPEYIDYSDALGTSLEIGYARHVAGIPVIDAPPPSNYHFNSSLEALTRQLSS